MLNGEIKVINELGLHARAAAQLVKLAERFASDISLINESESVMANAKSILSVLTLAAAKGVVLRLEVEGADEEEAYSAIRQLFESGFGELEQTA